MIFLTTKDIKQNYIHTMKPILTIHIVTLFPELFQARTENTLIGRANNNQIIQFIFINPRTFTSDRHQTVDDKPYGP
jgi:tRNA (guanine37-N1)-methyltransferase